MRTNWRTWSVRTSRTYHRKLWQTSPITFEKKNIVYSFWKLKCLIDTVQFFGSSILFFFPQKQIWRLRPYFISQFFLFPTPWKCSTIFWPHKIDLVLIHLFKKVFFYIDNKSLHSGCRVSNLVKKFIFCSKLVPVRQHECKNSR